MLRRLFKKFQKKAIFLNASDGFKLLTALHMSMLGSENAYIMVWKDFKKIIFWLKNEKKNDTFPYKFEVFCPFDGFFESLGRIRAPREATRALGSSGVSKYDS